MTDYAILRFAKLKTWGQIGGSLSHNYRTRDTPNADSDLTHLNEHSHETTQTVKNDLAARIPENRRKDAVMCLEHLFTASPDWHGWGTEKETEYFEISKKWLEDTYGKENVIATSIHRDETTPHFVAYVVPLDETTGRLNAKKWTAGSVALSKMQTNFAKKVAHLGLDRGIENSQAKHVSIQKYYSKVEKALEAPEIDLSNVPKKGVFENNEKYAERVIEAVMSEVVELKIRANEIESSKREVEALRKIAQDAEPYLDAIRHLPIEFKNELDKKIKIESDQLHEAYERQKQQEIEQYEQLKHSYYEFENYVNDCFSEKNNTEKDIEKREVKTEKWINKKDLTHDEVREDQKRLGGGVYEIPDYYITPYDAKIGYENAYRKFKQKVAEEAETANIESVVFSLKEKSIESNVIKDLNDFDEIIKPVITEFKLETKQQAEQRVKEQQNEQRRDAQRAENERIQKEALETYRNEKRAESERNKAVLKHPNNDVEKKIDRDNDFSM